MTPPKSKNDQGRTGTPGDATNRRRKSPNTDKNLTRTGELSIEQVKRWLESRRAADAPKRESDEDGGASASP